MTIPEVGEIAIQQMYRKCVKEIGDSRQQGNIEEKEKPWLCHDLSYHRPLVATPASLTVTSYVVVSFSIALPLTQSASVPSIQIYT